MRTQQLKTYGMQQKQLYGKEKKNDNLEEINRFVEKFSLPRLNKEEIEIMNNPSTSTEI